jgi:hypothetical protein
MSYICLETLVSVSWNSYACGNGVLVFISISASMSDTLQLLFWATASCTLPGWVRQTDQSPQAAAIKKVSIRFKRITQTISRIRSQSYLASCK